jgi:hypothetical protein
VEDEEVGRLERASVAEEEAEVVGVVEAEREVSTGEVEGGAALVSLSGGRLMGRKRAEGKRR